MPEKHLPPTPTPKDDLLKSTHKPTKVVLKWVMALVGVIVLLIFSIVLWVIIQLNNVVSNVPVNGSVIEIQPNSSLEQIAQQLQSQNLITNTWVFLLYAKLGPAHGKLIPGPYLIKPTNNIRQIVDNMATGKIAINKITFPEGITIDEMGKRYQAAGYGKKEDYIAATKQIAKEYSFIPSDAQANPEGFLYPATYVFTINSPAEVLVRKQYDAFQLNALPLIQGNNSTGLSNYQLLTLASIVEKEALTTEDRKLVAGVFLNRIRIGMKLESDVTVNYGSGKSVTSALDVQTFSPYNTYFIAGLPPTPINNPSNEAIETVLNPTQSDYLFFLAGQDGKVYYAKNLAEHNENIKNHL